MNVIQKHKINVRKNDRKWFKKRIPQEMMDLYQIHHTWDTGCFTFLVTPEEHMIIEGF